MTTMTARLAQLQELPDMPPPFSYWPQTWGWLVLAGVVLVLLALWCGSCYWCWQRDRYRREAMVRLDELERAMATEEQRVAALRELPELLKRVALSMPGKPQAATLGGSAWQAFLQQHSRVSLPADFSFNLATLAFAPEAQLQAMPAEQVQALLASTRLWIDKHHVAV